jgi:hypothetical protein
MTVKLRVEWHDNDLNRWISHHAWDNYLRKRPLYTYNQDLKERYSADYVEDGRFDDAFLHFEDSEDLCAFLMEWS